MKVSFIYVHSGVAATRTGVLLFFKKLYEELTDT
jgi:hypothetical protein